MLALQQPMAGDLRAILAALTINYEVERSGDLVENIAKALRRIYGVEFSPRLRGVITQMSGGGDPADEVRCGRVRRR